MDRNIKNRSSRKKHQKYDVKVTKYGDNMETTWRKRGDTMETKSMQNGDMVET